MAHALEKIPESRRAAVFAAHNLARVAFEGWATINAPELPDDEIDAMQVQLARWQVSRFGGTGGDPLMALGIVEEMGETADAAHEGFADINGGAEQAVDGLGDTMVYASQLCTANRLAIRPILDLAKLYTKHENTTSRVIMTAAGMLAHVVLKHDQGIRGMADPNTYRIRLVDAVALCIAKAIDECEMGHNLTVSAPGVLLAVGKEILERKAGDAMIPALPTMTTIVAPTLADAEAIRVEAVARLQSGIEALDLSDVHAHITQNLCPQCAGLLSQGDDTTWACPNGHSLTTAQLETLRASSPR